MKFTTLGFILFSLAAYAQVPADVAKKLINIGDGVCVPQTAQVYRPMHGNPPYKGVNITRDISFGPDKQDVADVFSPEKGGGNRTVLLYLPGGAGNKLQGGPNGDVFYDNIGLWGTKNNMVVVLMQRHAGANWDDPAKDVSRLVQWIGDNIAKYKGNPNRVFLWSQSAGNIPTATYVGHSETWGPKGIGLKGVVFMSAPGFSLLPATPRASQPAKPCGTPDAPAPPPAATQAKGKGGNGKGKAEQPDQATLLARSNLSGLLKAPIPYYITEAKLDSPNVLAFNQLFRDEMTKGKHPIKYDVFAKHSHISEVMSPNTKDTSVTGPILKWIKSVK